MENHSENKKELATITDSLTTFKSMDDLQAWGDKIAKSGLTPLKEGKDVVVAVLFGRELGMTPMVSVNNIYPINGKGSIGVHMINALLQKAGVVVEVIRDYEPCSAFALKGDDGKAALFDGVGNLVKRDTNGNIPVDANKNPLGIPVILREGFADESPRDNEVKSPKISNWKTVLRFTRMLKQPNGTFKEMCIDYSYSLQEAISASLYPKKDNWKNFPKQMCYARALAFGGRLIGGDIMLGMYETSELADTFGREYTVEGQTVIIKEPTKSANTESATTVEEVREKEESSSSVE